MLAAAAAVQKQAARVLAVLVAVATAATKAALCPHQGFQILVVAAALAAVKTSLLTAARGLLLLAI